MPPYKKLLLTGIYGQVGHALNAKVSGLADEIIALDRSKLDLASPNTIRQAIRYHRPDIVINPAAYTAVDKAEVETELAYAVNTVAPTVLAEECAKLNALLVHYSTDYVFDGTKSSPYIETDATNPINAYGLTKLKGEQGIQATTGRHLILRTSWVYGAYGNNFMRTILRLMKNNTPLRIISDQYGAPTSSSFIAEYTVKILQHLHNTNTEHQGLYHLVNSGHTSWFGFAEAIATLIKLNKRDIPPNSFPSEIDIQAIRATDYITAANRPKNSRLNTSKLYNDFNLSPPEWYDELNQQIKIYKSTLE